MENNNQFKFTYSAPTEEERREIESIRRRYTADAPTEDRSAELKRLDAHVKNTSNAIAIAVGVIGTLVMGLGMALVMEFEALALGIVLGVFGIGILSLAYPAYITVLRYEKKKYGARIIELSDQLLAGSENSENNAKM